VQVFVRAEMFWRGKIVDMDDASFPGWMVGYIGSNAVPIEAQFKGLLLAPNASVTLARVDQGSHEGQFFGKSIEVHPDMRIVFRSTDFMADPPLGKVLYPINETAPGCGSNLKLTGRTVDSSGFVKNTSVSYVSPSASCPEVTFCDGEYGRGNPIDVKARIDNPPFNVPNDLVACQNEARISTSSCPIDPSTVDLTKTCNVDRDCPNYRKGEICSATCQTADCKTTVKHCGTPHLCDGLDVDPRGCAPADIWQCSTKPDQNKNSEAYARSQITVKSAGATVSASQRLAAPQYLTISDTMDVCRTPTGSIDVKAGDDHAPSATDTAQSAGASADSINPIQLGNDQFGLFIVPQLFHSANIKPDRVDLFDAQVKASGSMVAGAKVFGQSKTALSMEAHGQAGVCGYDAGATIIFFGDEVAGFAPRANPEADLELSSLAGFLDGAARVHFLFFSETFRVRITEWDGFHQTFPLASVKAEVPLDFGPMADAVAYTTLPLWVGKKGTT